MRIDPHRKPKSGRVVRKCAIGLSAVAGLIAGAPTASSAGGLPGMWKHVTAAANTYEVCANAAACCRMISEYGAAIAHRLIETLPGAFDTMIPTLEIVFVCAALKLLVVFCKQGLCHIVLRGIEERLEQLPGDKTVTRSVGIGEIAFVLPPTMHAVYPECRAWLPIRALSYNLRKHPIDAAQALRRIDMRTASVDELRCVLRLLRKSWLFEDERATLDYVQMRSFDLRDFPDSSGEIDGAGARNGDADDRRQGEGTK